MTEDWVKACFAVGGETTPRGTCVITIKSDEIILLSEAMKRKALPTADISKSKHSHYLKHPLVAIAVRNKLLEEGHIAVMEKKITMKNAEVMKYRIDDYGKQRHMFS